MNNKSGL